MTGKPPERKKSASFATHKRDWEELARMDPFYAILSDSEQKFGKWDPEKFFQSGENEISTVMERVSKAGYLRGRDCALDFGCGVGRLTRALSRRFGECYGIDISENMITRATELNKDISNCKFLVNPEEDLRLFPDNYFDLVYTSLVLQHIPGKLAIESYIAEFLRVIKSGGLLVFQMPARIKPIYRLQPSRRLYGLLRWAGFSPEFLYTKLGFQPIRYTVIPEVDIVSFLQKIGAKVLEIQPENGKVVSSRTYYVTKP